MAAAAASIDSSTSNCRMCGCVIFDPDPDGNDDDDRCIGTCFETGMLCGHRKWEHMSTPEKILKRRRSRDLLIPRSVTEWNIAELKKSTDPELYLNTIENAEAEAAERIKVYKAKWATTRTISAFEDAPRIAAEPKPVPIRRRPQTRSQTAKKP